MREAAVGNALSPTVDSRVSGTISADVDDDLSLCLELMSATRRSSSQRYSGARLWHADSGRREPTVSTQHVVVLANSSLEGISFFSLVQYRSTTGWPKK